LVNDFYNNTSVIVGKFKKVSCKVKSLHDEFIRCLREERFMTMQDEKISYSREELHHCIKINNYNVQLPQNARELFIWGEDLNNCIAGYFDEVLNKETIIYGVFRDTTLMFAVEIEDHMIVQASGKYNADLTEEENVVLDTWFKAYLIENEKKEEKIA